MATTIKNIDSLINKFDGISNIDIEEYVKEATAMIHSNAKMLAPARTGKLRGSIHMEMKKEIGKVTGRVYTNLEYAPYVEFGTGSRGDGNYPYADEIDFQLQYKDNWAGMSPQPYMYPAIKGAEKQIKDLIIRGMQDAIGNICGGGK